MKKPPTAEFWDVSKFKEHPYQNELFDPPTEEEVASSTKHYKEVGGPRLVYACSDGTLIYGIVTIKASIAAGLFSIPTIVRDDLGTADRPEVLKEMIRLYRSNQDMDQMTIGRCYKKLREIMLGSRLRLGSFEVCMINITLGNFLSKKTVQQLGRLAELPRSIHPLIERGKLTKKQAENLRVLSPDKKQAALLAIESGEKIKAVVSQFELNKSSKSKGVKKQSSGSQKDPFRTPGHLEKISAEAHASNKAFWAKVGDNYDYKPMPSAKTSLKSYKSLLNDVAQSLSADSK